MSKAAKTNGKRETPMGDDDVIIIDGSTATTALQAGSERRAVVNRIIDLGGRAKVVELERLFGFEIRPLLRALSNVGWVRVEPATSWRGKMPRRSPHIRKAIEQAEAEAQKSA